VFPENALGTRMSEAVISGGNFHGAPLAYSFDYAALALTDLASITERRIDRLLESRYQRGSAGFLSPNPGLSSGS